MYMIWASGEFLGAPAYDHSLYSHGGQCTKGALSHTEGQRDDCCAHVQQGTSPAGSLALAPRLSIGIAHCYLRPGEVVVKRLICSL